MFVWQTINPRSVRYNQHKSGEYQTTKLTFRTGESYNARSKIKSDQKYIDDNPSKGKQEPGEEPRFGMTIVMTYKSTFTRAMGEVVRILYRSKEKGVVLLNSKAGDFASYSLPRLSVQNWEEDHEGSSNRGGSRRENRYESNRVDSSDLGSKTKVKLKSPCLNIKVKTKPVTRENRYPGS